MWCVTYKITVDDVENFIGPFITENAAQKWADEMNAKELHGKAFFVEKLILPDQMETMRAKDQR